MTEPLHILLAGAFEYPWYEESCAKGLETLGHRVSRYAWGDDFVGLWGKLQYRALIGPTVRRVNRGLIERSCEIGPDVILIWRGVPIGPDTIRNLQLETEALITAYNNDDPFGASEGERRWRNVVEAIPYFDQHFVYRPVNVADYKRCGARKVSVLMPYYVSDLHFPVQLDDGDEERYGCDAVFAGHWEDDGREQFIRALIAAGLNVQVFGSSDTWRHADLGKARRHVGKIEPVYGAEYRKALSGASLCLNFLSERNRDVYTRRCFEIPACRGLLISERTEALRSLFMEGTEAVYFSNTLELVDRAHALLASPARRAAIEERGYCKCRSEGYDVVSRMQEFVSICLQRM